MNKGQEKTRQGTEGQAKSKITFTLDPGGSNSSILSPFSQNMPSTSRNVPSESHGLRYKPINKFPVKNSKNEFKEVDKIDDPNKKKRNRRRERHSHKPRLNDMNSSDSTPQSSPSISKSKLVTSMTDNIVFPLIFPKNSFKDFNGIRNVRESCSKFPVRSSPSSSSSSVNIECKFTYKIYPAQNLKNGKFFKKRNDKCKHINLYSFNGSKKTCVFNTSLDLLTSILKDLNLGAQKDSRNRKYYKSSHHPQSKYVQTTMTEPSRHGNILIEKTDRGCGPNQVSENILIVEDGAIKARQETSRNSETENRKKSKQEKRKQHKLEKKAAKSEQEVFPNTVTAEMAKAGEQSGELIRGFIRLNPKNFRDSYVSNADSTLADYYLTSVADRNTALDGDEVLLKIKPETEWQEDKKTAVVVYILKKVHPRITVGNLKPSGQRGFATFYPRDKRMPIMLIPEISWPIEFKNNSKGFANTLFVARLVEWPSPGKTIGVIIETLGLSGDLQVETMSILRECCLDLTPFSPEMIQYLPKSKTIPQEEFERREDVRKECIFTIDPLTARDLDDAVSVKELPNGNYEIGVHISDASYYLPEGTPLDQLVSSKATTIYLVNSVYHMLPVELCLHCSLLPGEDKLAFSVFWEMNEDGEIFNTRFVRTILNSCAQLAYEHAQQMIEDPNKEFKKEDLPQIFNGFTAKHLSKTVNVLQKIAVKLRERRIQNGSLRIDQIKLLFSLHPKSGEPLDFIAYENKESHRLIEEFMLLANISVAKKISEHFPDLAFLRCHEEPKFTMLAEAQACLKARGIDIDISSSGSINSSLWKYITDDYEGLCRGIVLNHIFAKPMTRARYFCAGTMDDEESYAHYALSVPIYTHFTSPIRRYADIMVHRLLAASLGYAEKPNWNLEHVISIANNCNIQKYNAKRAGEASSNLYLAHYIETKQPYVQDCVVISVKETSFDAIVLKTGSVVRVYQNKCQDNPSWKMQPILQSTKSSDSNKPKPEKKVFRLLLHFPATKKDPISQEVRIEMFTVVKVQLKRVPNSSKLEAYLLRPFLSRTFKRGTSSTSS